MFLITPVIVAKPNMAKRAIPRGTLAPWAAPAPTATGMRGKGVGCWREEGESVEGLEAGGSGRADVVEPSSLMMSMVVKSCMGERKCGQTRGCGEVRANEDRQSVW